MALPLHPPSPLEENIYSCIFVLFLFIQCFKSCCVQFRPFCQVWRLGPLDLTHRPSVVSSLVTVCPSRSSVHRFLGLTSTKQGVNVTCSRPRNVHRSGLEPETPWSEIRRPNHCATPPPCFKRVTHLAVIAILPCGPMCKHIYIYIHTVITS